MRSIVIGLGLLVLSLMLFKISEVNFIQGNVRLEVIVAIASIIFFFIGVYFNKPSKTTALPSSPASSPINYEQIKKIGLLSGNSVESPIPKETKLNDMNRWISIKGKLFTES